VWLHVHIDPTTPFALTAALALATMIYFQYLRLTDHPAVAPARKPPPNPLKYLPRFFHQPRLRPEDHGFGNVDSLLDQKVGGHPAFAVGGLVMGKLRQSSVS